MNAKKWMQVAAMTSAFGFASAVLAADNGQMGMDRNGSMGMGHDTTTSPLGKTPETAGTGGNDQSMSPPMDTWMNDYAATHNGRITREEFMNEMARRWDMHDAQRRGYMTPDEARQIYGTDEGQGQPRTGSDATPRYMGPNSARGQ